MKFAWIFAVGAALAGCSPEAPPAPAPVVQAPIPAPAPPPIPPPQPLKRRPPPPAPAPAPPMEDARPLSAVSSPIFSLEVLSGTGEVWINGERAGATPYRWGVSPETRFDPRFEIVEWPPAGARAAAQGRVLSDEGRWISMEVWIADEEAPKRYPGLAEGEHLLFVRAELPGSRVQGALRVRIPGHRFVSYMPTSITRESPDFQRWSRALWFERR